jgi:hypothetical protein
MDAQIINRAPVPDVNWPGGEIARSGGGPGGFWLVGDAGLEPARHRCRHIAQAQ